MQFTDIFSWKAKPVFSRVTLALRQDYPLFATLFAFVSRELLQQRNWIALLQFFCGNKMFKDRLSPF